jgi:hypothetical protein
MPTAADHSATWSSLERDADDRRTVSLAPNLRVSRPGRFYCLGNYSRYPLNRGLDGLQSPFGRFGRNKCLASVGNRSPDRPARRLVNCIS